MKKITLFIVLWTLSCAHHTNSLRPKKTPQNPKPRSSLSQERQVVPTLTDPLIPEAVQNVATAGEEPSHEELTSAPAVVLDEAPSVVAAFPHYLGIQAYTPAGALSQLWASKAKVDLIIANGHAAVMVGIWAISATANSFEWFYNKLPKKLFEPSGSWFLSLTASLSKDLIKDFFHLNFKKENLENKKFNILIGCDQQLVKLSTDLDTFIEQIICSVERPLSTEAWQQLMHSDHPALQKLHGKWLEWSYFQEQNAHTKIPSFQIQEDSSNLRWHRINIMMDTPKSSTETPQNRQNIIYNSKQSVLNILNLLRP